MNKKHLTLLAAALFFTSGMYQSAQAKARIKAGKESASELNAEKSRGTAADANVKNDSDKNSKNDARPAPGDKGGEKTRGGVARLHVDNHTKWFLRCYTQGSYDGTISPYGDGYVNFRNAPGTVTLYLKAVFDDGTYFSWGPKEYRLVPGEVHNVRVNP
jgi:hypothetical protein